MFGLLAEMIRYFKGKSVAEARANRQFSAPFSRRWQRKPTSRGRRKCKRCRYELMADHTLRCKCGRLRPKRLRDR